MLCSEGTYAPVEGLEACLQCPPTMSMEVKGAFSFTEACSDTVMLVPLMLPPTPAPENWQDAVLWLAEFYGVDASDVYLAE